MSDDLTPKQSRFVAEYLIDLNATQAAIRAGYAPGSATVEGSRLLANAKVAAAVAARQKKIAEKLSISVEKIVAELAKIGFADIRKAVKWNGSVVSDEENLDGDVLITREIRNNLVLLIDSDDLDDDTAAAISEISQNATGGVRLKMHDKKGALVDLGRHLGMFVDRSETVVTINDRTEQDAERFTGGIARIASRAGTAKGNKPTVN